MPDMYTMFRLMVAVCFACVVMSLFLYLSLQPYYSGEIGGPGPAVASKEAPSSKGLYFNSKSVDELNPYTYSIISEGKNPSIILYYASWCGHCRYSTFFCAKLTHFCFFTCAVCCRHFVPMYNTLASETNARVLDINKEKQSRKGWRKRATHRTYSPLRFTAIDCAEYSTICAKAGISSYPTLKTYNIGGASGIQDNSVFFRIVPGYST